MDLWSTILPADLLSVREEEPRYSLPSNQAVCPWRPVSSPPVMTLVAMATTEAILILLDETADEASF